ncbi:hypothetical protein AB0L10_16500 [Streptomyces flaveolus]|uniref:hypothetical protein n=1 Tax=Streptomyces flaveolus TaxID=67297 RepID=UPI0034436127
MKPGKYYAGVFVFGEPNEEVRFTFQANLVGPSGTRAPGTFGVSPTHPSATPGEPLTVTTRWSGVATDCRSTAYVACPNGSGTFVGIN